MRACMFFNCLITEFEQIESGMTENEEEEYPLGTYIIIHVLKELSKL